nr:hypothetical protein [Candidatus Sigynarchaeota archaeon]
MNKAIDIASTKGGRYPNPKHARAFVAEVFKVHDPPCPSCKNDMAFYIFENFQGTGQDWIQWSCARCGFAKNIEIL